MKSFSFDFDAKMSYLINLYFALGFSLLLLYYLSNACFNTAAERQIKKIRNLLYKSIIRQDMGFFDKNTTGKLTETLNAYELFIYSIIGNKH